ncbi:hypothetical protein [Flavobacterium sp. ZB4P13]|uniref:hypothetical protein n=1 Tax=Flavobacterium sp. ZB4P13 TaxID=3401728 RepID=UPI003AAB992E
MEAPERDDFCYWTFIEKYYPNYYSCDDILLSNILLRKLESQEICNEDEEMIQDWDVKKQLLELDKNIFSKALKNYFEIKYP